MIRDANLVKKAMQLANTVIDLLSQIAGVHDVQWLGAKAWQTQQ